MKGKKWHVHPTLKTAIPLLLRTIEQFQPHLSNARREGEIEAEVRLLIGQASLLASFSALSSALHPSDLPYNSGIPVTAERMPYGSSEMANLIQNIYERLKTLSFTLLASPQITMETFRLAGMITETLTMLEMVM